MVRAKGRRPLNRAWLQRQGPFRGRRLLAQGLQPWAVAAASAVYPDHQKRTIKRKNRSMKNTMQATWVELFKARRSKMPLLTGLGFLMIPFVGGFFFGGGEI